MGRAVAPALGGLAIATFSIALPFWCFCGGNIAVLAALMWCLRAPRRARRTLPAERLMSALRTRPALRQEAIAISIRASHPRAVAFFPLRERVLGAPSSRRAHADAQRARSLRLSAGHGRRGLDSWIVGAQKSQGAPRFRPPGDSRTLGTILALALYGGAGGPVIAALASLQLREARSWITMMIARLFVSAQLALPEWVRGSGPGDFSDSVFRRDDPRRARFGARSPASRGCRPLFSSLPRVRPSGWP